MTGEFMTVTADARRILAVQALRAFAYGLGSILIGVTLARRGLSGFEVGLVLSALLAGVALASIAIARTGDRVGRLALDPLDAAAELLGGPQRVDELEVVVGQ